MIVSSLGSSKMLAAEIEDVVEVFLDEVPEMPESAESFLVKCLPTRKRGICILFCFKEEKLSVCSAGQGGGEMQRTCSADFTVTLPVLALTQVGNGLPIESEINLTYLWSGPSYP